MIAEASSLAGAQSEVASLQNQMKQQLWGAEERLREVEAAHATELSRREEAARHELHLEKEAAAKATAALEEKLRAEQAKVKEAGEGHKDVVERLRAAIERAEAAEGALAASTEAADAYRARCERAEARRAEMEAELKEAEMRGAAWKDERAALQTELNAERRHAELNREGVDARLREERALRESTEVLLETRLTELSSSSQPESLAQGAEALQTLLGAASATQATLEHREAVLADALALFNSRHAERLKAVEQAAAQRLRWSALESQLQAVLARVGSSVDASMQASPTHASPPSRAAAAKAASTAAAPRKDDLRSLVDPLKEVAGLLRAASQANTSVSETVAGHEASVQSAISQFTAHNSALQVELQAAKERIVELQRGSGQPVANGRPLPQQHRPAPQQHRPAPPGGASVRRGEVGSSMGSGAKGGAAKVGAANGTTCAAAPARFASAEYLASAPSPGRR